MSILTPPIKTQLVGEALDLGMKILNAMSTKLGQATIGCSQMPLSKFYAMKNVVVMEMKVREVTLNKKVHALNKIVSKMKKTIK